MSEWKWVVLSGLFTGDGDRTHALYRNEDGDRVPIFNNKAAAEDFIVQHRLGKHCLLAEVVMTSHPATELRYPSGSRVTVTEAR